MTVDSQAASVASQVLQDCLYRPLSDPSPLSCDSGTLRRPRWPVRSSRTVCTRPLSDPSPLSCDSGLSGGLGGQSGPPGLSVLCPCLTRPPSPVTADSQAASVASQVLQDCLYSAPCLTRPPSPVTADSQAASVASQVLQDCLYSPLSDPSPLSCDSGLSGGLGGQSGSPGLSVSPPV